MLDPFARLNLNDELFALGLMEDGSSETTPTASSPTVIDVQKAFLPVWFWPVVAGAGAVGLVLWLKD